MFIITKTDNISYVHGNNVFWSNEWHQIKEEVKMDRSRAMKTMKSILMESVHQYDDVEHKSISEWVYTYKVGEDLPDVFCKQ